MAALEFADPALGDRIDRHGVDEMQLLAALTLHGDEVRAFQYRQMLGYGLAGHGESCAQIIQGLPIATVQPVQQRPATGIGQRPENVVLTHADIMQPNGCMSSRRKGPRSGTGLCIDQPKWKTLSLLPSGSRK